jgi:alpha-ribazole phosphatase/probable phosphoglycerate mutase
MSELNCGIWEGRVRKEVLSGEIMRATWHDGPPGGESYADAELRVGSFIRELNASESSDSILVVGHAGVNRVFLKLWLGLPPEYAVKIHFSHDTLYMLDGGEVSGMSVSLGRLEGLVD